MNFSQILWCQWKAEKYPQIISAALEWKKRKEEEKKHFPNRMQLEKLKPRKEIKQHDKFPSEKD